MLRRWEHLDTWKQVVIGGPVMIVLMFLLNWLPFQQPVERSIGYAFIEGIPFTALLIVATHHERSKREQAARVEPNDDHDRG